MKLFLILLTVYCILHSVLADAHLMRRIYYRWWYRFFYVVQSLVLLIPVVWIYHTMPSEYIFNPSNAMKAVLLIIWLSALAFGAYAAKSYDNSSFLGIEQLRAKLRGERYHYTKPVLTKKGALAIVRHPYYTASLVLIWSRPLQVKDMYLNIVLTIYFLLGTINEERKLRREFGDEYLQYCREVPALIPFTKLRG